MTAGMVAIQNGVGSPVRYMLRVVNGTTHSFRHLSKPVDKLGMA